MILSKNETRKRRKVRIRKKISGTADRPRLVVYRSNLHIYAQIVDDAAGVTLAAASTLAQERNIRQVVFDRNGYLYHGRIKAVADGAREGGLEF